MLLTGLVEPELMAPRSQKKALASYPDTLVYLSVFMHLFQIPCVPDLNYQHLTALQVFPKTIDISPTCRETEFLGVLISLANDRWLCENEFHYLARGRCRF